MSVRGVFTNCGLSRTRIGFGTSFVLSTPKMGTLRRPNGLFLLRQKAVPTSSYAADDRCGGSLKPAAKQGEKPLSVLLVAGSAVLIGGWVTETILLLHRYRSFVRDENALAAKQPL